MKIGDRYIFRPKRILKLSPGVRAGWITSDNDMALDGLIVYIKSISRPYVNGVFKSSNKSLNINVINRTYSFHIDTLQPADIDYIAYGAQNLPGDKNG